MQTARRYRIPPPDLTFKEVAKGMSYDDLVQAVAAFQRELNQRTGREKYQLPPTRH